MDEESVVIFAIPANMSHEIFETAYDLLKGLLVRGMDSLGRIKIDGVVLILDTIDFRCTCRYNGRASVGIR